MPPELSTQPLPRGRKPWTACSLLQLSALSSLLLSNYPAIPKPLETTNNHLPTCPQFGRPLRLELSLIRRLEKGLTEKRGQKKRALFVVQFCLSVRDACGLTSSFSLQFQISNLKCPPSRLSAGALTLWLIADADRRTTRGPKPLRTSPQDQSAGLSRPSTPGVQTNVATHIQPLRKGKAQRVVSKTRTLPRKSADAMCSPHGRFEIVLRTVAFNVYSGRH